MASAVFNDPMTRLAQPGRQNMHKQTVGMLGNSQIS